MQVIDYIDWREINKPYAECNCCKGMGVILDN